mmetsp:Transcript_86954/g.119806  ORF Transcript_86954/g.119806 Transcript_86954/m.119806 type:complete len:158 (-) Transcript_86954:131-604(-)|eukprot:CAMPEP_0176374832 /NCGR_PEP_ID=MMETSP0126-20121128/27060_1 /TAXON_ID=141414 ORGANISM="Strombidinopsis acuminatum, Strain SPMC142" /NCGR_SAMPLE_ID=MMETSP0126 /ASSEMBLY_ACC=CAM_ASM_000229 /LENGTH=157 /DNA_ID=CAMNT_0017735619 /DNA_START=162 /DNA_END=635 /DNA_ORIENTATION=+
MNPYQKIPLIAERDTHTGEVFYLTESHAILRYLHARYNCAESWYPSEIKARTKVDMYMDWHHTFLRQGAAGTVFRMAFARVVTGKTHSKEEIKFHLTYLRRSLTMMERWLTETQFLCGDKPTLADISAVCEIEQLHYLADYMDKHIPEKYPKVHLWH